MDKIAKAIKNGVREKPRSFVRWRYDKWNVPHSRKASPATIVDWIEDEIIPRLTN